MNLKIKMCFFLFLLFTEGIFLSSTIGLSQTSDDINIWNVKKGDIFEWEYYDNYYSSFSNITTTLNTTNKMIYSNQSYRVEYEYIKDYASSDLSLNISTSNSDIKKIMVNISYHSLYGITNISREYQNYQSGRIIETIIPLRMNVLLPRKNSPYPLYREPYNIKYGSTVITRYSGSLIIKHPLNDEIEIPSSVNFASMGLVSILFIDDVDTNIHMFTYSFHYISLIKDTNKKYLKNYTLSSFCTEIIDIKNTQIDNDNLKDLIVLNENKLGNSIVSVSIPSYIDTSTFTSFLHLLAFFSSASLPLGFSLPSGITILFSELSTFIQQTGILLPSLIKNILIPTLINTPPDIPSFLLNLMESNISLSSFFNSLVFLTYSAFLILPSNFNFNFINQTFTDIFNSINIRTTISNNNDKSNLLYILKNFITTEKNDEIFTMYFNTYLLPLLFDTNNGFTSFTFKLSWKKNILYVFESNINYITSGYGHTIGMKLKEKEKHQSWTTQFTQIILFFLSLFGIGSIGMIIRKKKIEKKAVVFQSIFSNTSDNFSY